jgi:DNA-binding Lrp family transcriptional regulator
MDPVTVARRWQRMERDGVAWVAAYPRLTEPGNVVTAVVEVDAEAGASPDVADAIARMPRAANVKETAGGRDLVVAVQAPTLGELARFVSLQLSRVPGVTATRTHLVTAVPTEGSSWRLRSLDADQRARLERAGPPAASPVRTPEWDADDATMLTLLSTVGCRCAASPRG